MKGNTGSSTFLFLPIHQHEDTSNTLFDLTVASTELLRKWFLSVDFFLCTLDTS